jgi:transcriptional regulator with XRE-family HTH domain
MTPGTFAVTPAAARERAGMDVGAAAKRVRVSVDYLRRIESGTGASFVLGQRLAALYGCPLDVFLCRKSKRKGDSKKGRFGAKSGLHAVTDGTSVRNLALKRSDQ